jgi:hypothetical protein
MGQGRRPESPVASKPTYDRKGLCFHREDLSFLCNTVEEAQGVRCEASGLRRQERGSKPSELHKPNEPNELNKPQYPAS